MTDKPRIRLHADGRISFPGIVQYAISTRFGRLVLPFPPTCDSHPAPPAPVPLASARTAMMVALGEIMPLKSSLPFTVEVIDLDAYNRPAASGLLYDPRHTGCAAHYARIWRRESGTGPSEGERR